MQRVAKEFNLAETSFILPRESTASATRVRIFTPNNEMEFAGHPTIGTAWVLRRLGMVPASATRFTLAENAGPIAVRVDAGDDPLLWLTTPAIRSLGVLSREACAAAVRLGADELAPDVPCRDALGRSPDAVRRGRGCGDGRPREHRRRVGGVASRRSARECRDLRSRSDAGRRVFRHVRAADGHPRRSRDRRRDRGRYAGPS